VAHVPTSLFPYALLAVRPWSSYSWLIVMLQDQNYLFFGRLDGLLIFKLSYPLQFIDLKADCKFVKTSVGQVALVARNDHSS
jgi:hypothetical protein